MGILLFCGVFTEEGDALHELLDIGHGLLSLLRMLLERRWGTIAQHLGGHWGRWQRKLAESSHKIADKRRLSTRVTMSHSIPKRDTLLRPRDPISLVASVPVIRTQTTMAAERAGVSPPRTPLTPSNTHTTSTQLLCLSSIRHHPWAPSRPSSSQGPRGRLLKRPSHISNMSSSLPSSKYKKWCEFLTA